MGLSCDTLHVHPGIIAQVRFCEGSGGGSAQRNSERQAHNRPGSDAVKGDAVKLFFLRRGEASVLRGPTGVVGGEAELGALRQDFELAKDLLVRNEISK